MFAYYMKIHVERFYVLGFRVDIRGNDGSWRIDIINCMLRWPKCLLNSVNVCIYLFLVYLKLKSVHAYNWRWACLIETHWMIPKHSSNLTWKPISKVKKRTRRRKNFIHKHSIYCEWNRALKLNKLVFTLFLVGFIGFCSSMKN